MGDLVYTKHKKPNSGPAHDLPTLAQLQEKQENELLELAQVRFGIMGSKVNVLLTPLKLAANMSESEIFKALFSVPETERADQVLYELAKGGLDSSMANRILAGLAVLGRFKKIKVD
jgi:hypothetical protein